MPIHKKITIANENSAGRMDDGDAAPDHVQPFTLEKSQLRGRIMRLPNAVNDVLSAHNYPEPIARQLAEGLCLTTLLAGMLKFDGIFTLQAKGEGPLSLLVCDITTDGILRGYAGFDADGLNAVDIPDFLALTVRGYLAFTVDQANTTERYQGITELHGVSLTESVQYYFRQSEQIATAFVTQITQDENGRWSGAAIMLQQLGLEGGTDKVNADDVEENWRRTMTLLNTIKPGELLDAATPLNTILYRLFHEEGVRVYAPIDIAKGCRCSLEKISAVLDVLPVEEKRDIAENGVITVTCEFCNTHYKFPVGE